MHLMPIGSNRAQTKQFSDSAFAVADRRSRGSSPGISRILDASRSLRVLLAVVVTMVVTGEPLVAVAGEIGGGAQAALAAVVSIETRDASGQLVGVGSGFFIHPDVITVPAHALRGATTGVARVIGAAESLRFIGITALDPELDLALVKVSGICSLALPVAGGGAPPRSGRASRTFRP